MGVSASVICVTCGVQAPGLGNGGHVGYPSLADREFFEGDLATFEYLYKGFAAIELRTAELEGFRAFLQAHRRHDVGLFLEGEEYAGRFDRPELGAKVFAFDDSDFVDGFYELTCTDCAETFRCQRPTQLRAVTSRSLSRTKLEAFVERVIDVDPQNFYRVFGVLSPDPDGELRSFIGDHLQHRVTVQTVVEQHWSRLGKRRRPTATGRTQGERAQVDWSPANVMPRPAAVAPPLELQWIYDRTSASADEVLVAGGQIFAANADSSALLCVSQAGRKLWATRVEGHRVDVGSNLVFDDEHVYYAKFASALEDRRLLTLDRATGRLKSRAAFPYHWLCSVGRGRVVGSAMGFGERRERRLALCRLDAPGQPVWCHAFTPDDPVSDKSFRDFVVADGVVLTTWLDDLVALRLRDGVVLWRRSLKEFGERTFWPASPMALSGTTLLLHSNQALLAFAVNTGKLRWQRPGMLCKPRTICEGVAYVIEPGGQIQTLPSAVVALNLRTGSELARADTGAGAFADAPAPLPMFTSAPAVGAHHVFAVETGRIWAFDRKTLKPVWMTRPPAMGGPWTTPVAYGKRLLVKGADGRLFCFQGPGRG
jgi:outer membrane protein assembly factor BamB